jgi:FtsZ-interacting cell division protein ZipA
VGGLSWQLTGIYGAVSVVAVVISGLWSRRKRTATPVHQNTGVSDT